MSSIYSKILGFTPVAPTPDTDELAATGQRLILRLGKQARHGQSVERTETSDNSLVVAPAGELCAGWVIGLKCPQL